VDLIKISNEYSIDINKYERLKVGDIIKSQSQLRKYICYPTITPDKANSGTVKRLQAVIDKLISHTNAGGNKIQILFITPTYEAKEIVENHVKSIKTMDSRQIYRLNRNYILDYIISTCEYNPIYLTTLDIIKESVSFQPFFHDYCNIHYDSQHSTKAEVNKLNDFVKKYAITDSQYLTTIMEMLSNILYSVFSSENIRSWANSYNVTYDRVLYQGGKELNEQDSDDLKNKYFQPLINKGVPAKSITKLANKNFMRENEVLPHLHKWFYFTHKFVTPDPFIVNVNDDDFMQNKFEISEKVIARLQSTAIDPHGGSYHAKNKNNLNYIINKLKIAQ